MKNIKYLMCTLIGFILAIGISNAYKLDASLVTYDKKNAILESENVQGAIDELGNSAIDKKNQIIESLSNKGITINSDSNFDEIISAINNYEPSGTLKYIKLGNYFSGSTRNIDIKAYVSNWESLTANNFATRVTKLQPQTTGGVLGTKPISYSYDNTTGILTISDCYTIQDGGSTIVTGYMYYDAYVIYVD